jgi:hypothetical protein
MKIDIGAARDRQSIGTICSVECNVSVALGEARMEAWRSSAPCGQAIPLSERRVIGLLQSRGALVSGGKILRGEARLSSGMRGGNRSRGTQELRAHQDAGDAAVMLCT